MSLLVVIGTRPEAVKMAPVVRALRDVGVPTRLCVTGQHPHLVAPVLAAFGLTADRDLAAGGPRDLSGLLAQLLERVAGLLRDERPARVVVHGDTSSALAAALAASYARIPVAHVEAGLRTGDRAAPFPEEGHRIVIDQLCDRWFAPTPAAGAALLAEGCDAAHVHVTGNTVVDAVRWMHRRVADRPLSDWADAFGSALPALAAGAPLVLVTAHRRESFDGGLDRIAQAVRVLARARPDVVWLLPIHPHPRVGRALGVLADVPGVHVGPPLSYAATVRALTRSTLVLTDSGGLQEESASLGVPALVLRDVTERPEGIDAGWLRLVGTDPDRIVPATLAALAEPPTGTPDPFGDGRAAARIAAALA